MITIAALVLLAAPPLPTPTPTPPPSMRVLLRGGTSESAPTTTSLSDLAKRIKLKLPKDQPRKLTNETVKELAKGVELTTALPYQGSSADTAGGEGGEGGLSEQDALRQKWQERYQQARAEAVYWGNEVTRLEGEVARLESQFYAWDDPAYRDGVIKPAWDKALVDLRTARERREQARSKPDQVIEEARREGALPGWFRGLPEPDAESGRPPEKPQS